MHRRGLLQAYSTVCKQAGAFRLHSTFRTCFAHSMVAAMEFGHYTVLDLTTSHSAKTLHV